jgi:hypothetical protein
MAWAHVQSTTATGHNVDSVAQAFASSVTAGSLLVVCVSHYTSTSGNCTVSDSKSQTYTQVGTQMAGLHDSSQKLEVWYTENAGAGATTITVNPPGSSSDIRIAILEYSGISTSGSVDVTISAQADTASTAVDTSNLTTTQANDLLVGVMTHYSATMTITPSASYTQRQENETNSADCAINVEDRNAATAGNYNATWTTASSSYWMCRAVAFKQAASSQIKKAASVAQASIKKVLGVANASVKELSGVPNS